MTMKQFHNSILAQKIYTKDYMKIADLAVKTTLETNYKTARTFSLCNSPKVMTSQTKFMIRKLKSRNEDS